MGVIVTVGIPVYNRLEGFERAIKSVLAQTYSHLQILISNDNSPNPSIDLLAKKYANLDSRILYTYHSNSLRTVGNFEWLKSNAKGKYFVWLADDDWMENDYIEKCVSFLEVNSDYAMAGGLCYYHESPDKIIHSSSSFSLSQDIYFQRMFTFFRKVTLNGYFYGLQRTSIVREYILPNQLGFDWNLIGYVCFRGKIKILSNTGHHISSGGMSNEGIGLRKYFPKKNYLLDNFMGLSVSLNCTRDLFTSSLYKLNKVQKILLCPFIFIGVYLNTISWDILFIKRKCITFLGINSDGILFKQSK
jgi:glycosyltransferase involved in cell wall biosynthesis